MAFLTFWKIYPCCPAVDGPERKVSGKKDPAGSRHLRSVFRGGKRATVGRKGLAVGACVGHLQVCEETREEDDWRIMRQWALMS
ncbi:hypothetical protein TNCV_496951 [Trichonephila clavipes]|nr:hypothetical protein TNCV_496951 [Trichonephila clavipes]